VHQIASSFYSNRAEGLSGNEDCGQMSAWYVFAAMGMYPVCPGHPAYTLAAPLFKKMVINFENGKSMSITSDQTVSNVVHDFRLNGKSLQGPEVWHNAFTDSGTLEFRFTAAGESESEKNWNDINTSVTAVGMIPAPLITSGFSSFKDTLVVAFESLPKGDHVIYKDSLKTSAWQNAPENLVIKSNSVLYARTVKDRDSSAVTRAQFYKLKYDYRILLFSSPDPQYAADGPESLIDGRPPETNWKKGNWIGVQGKDFECQVDLGDKKSLGSAGLTCLQDIGSWISFPSEIQFYRSDDGEIFSLIGTVKNTIPMNDSKVQINNFRYNFPDAVELRYLKIVAKNPGQLPAWHPGKGGESYIFAAELEVK
jgi:hypothetical protein